MTDSNLPLAGKHARVTGGARGIGAACVRALLTRGARVTIAGREAAALAAMQTALALGRARLLKTRPRSSTDETHWHL